MVGTSDPNTLEAEISQDKNYIILQGRNVGVSLLYLSVNDNEAHDIIPVKVGVLI